MKTTNNVDNRFEPASNAVNEKKGLVHPPKSSFSDLGSEDAKTMHLRVPKDARLRTISVLLLLLLYGRIAVSELISHPTLSTSVPPGAPNDLRILPLTDTQLDVDIHPAQSVAPNGEMIGEPTRYNISYQFRMWRKNTNVQLLSIEQSSGLVLSTMRMPSAPNFNLFTSTPEKVVDYVYQTMGNGSSSAPAPLGTCARGICSALHADLNGVVVKELSSYDLIYHGYSHFALNQEEATLANSWQIRVRGHFSYGAILGVNKRILRHSTGDSSMQEMDISFMSMMIIYTTCLLLAAFVFAMYWDYHTAQQKRRELELSRMHEKNATSRFKALKKKVAMAAVKGKPGVSGKRKAGVLATVRAEYGAKSSEYEEMVKDSIAEGRFKQHADFLKEVRQEFGPTSMEYKTLFNILQRLTEIEYEPSLRAEKPPSKAPFFNGMFAFSRTAKSKNKKKLTAVTPIQEPSSETKQANATPNKDNASKKTPQVLQAGISIDVPPPPGKKTSNPKRLSL